MIYTAEEIAVLKEGGQRLGTVLGELVDRIGPGVSTTELDAYAHDRIREFGGRPSFLGYQGALSTRPFPSSLCISINHEVVHAPATPPRRLSAGDIVGLDLGMRYPAEGGLCTDIAVTVGVGAISAAAERLLRVTREALERGIQAVGPGVRMRDVSTAIQRHVEAAGYSIVRDLVGHGVGRHVHEDPEVPNFVVSGPIGDYELTPGLVIAIEPMVNAGATAVRTKADQWTVTTKDKSLSAHFEHTVAVTADGCVVLTTP